MRRWPSWMNTMPRITASAMNGIITTNTWSGLFHQAETARRQAAHDRGEDQQRDPVADAALGDQLAHPHQQRRAGGERDDDQEELAEGQRADDALALLAADRPEQVDEADRLRRRQRDRQVARVLRDLLLADLALLLEALERGNGDGQQLQDDRRRDVGHDPEREQREVREPAAREQVQEAEDVRPAELVVDALDRVEVDARARGCGRRSGRARGSRNVKRILRRISGTLKELAMVAITASPPAPCMSRRRPRSPRAPWR